MKKIGIVTFHSSHNYGSLFQAFAMAHVMRTLGLDAHIIDFRHPATTARFEFVWWYKGQSLQANLSNLIYRGLFGQGKKRERMFNEFIERNFPLTKRVKSYHCINEHFDYLVCGSDQIWNPKSTGKNDPIYFLDFDDDTTVRFSYAASSGSTPFADGHEAEIKKYLSRMTKIGVREFFMKEYIYEKFGLVAEVTPDPTILVDANKWQELEEEVINIPKEYLIVYTIRNKEQCLKFAKGVAIKLGLPIIFINPGRGRKDRAIKGADYTLCDISPGQWLWLYHHAEFVVSNTFHGNAFSVIYRKNFVCYAPNLSDTRIVTLHKKIGLGESRLISNSDDFGIANKEIDYLPIENKIKKFQNEGLSFLKSCISLK